MYFLCFNSLMTENKREVQAENTNLGEEDLVGHQECQIVDYFGCACTRKEKL